TEQWVDQITLDQVAERAGVTVQTILRHFGSKEGLWTAAGQAANDRATRQRQDAPVGDILGAVRNLLDHYEEFGAGAFRGQALEGRYPEIDALIQEDRLKHREWVERVFAPFLAKCKESESDLLIAELITLCDLYVWKLLRLDLKLTREQVEQALVEM